MARAIALACVLLLASPASATEYRLRVVARAGMPSPVGGAFDRFSVERAPVVAPINGRGEVAFFATLVRSATAEGIFLSTNGRLVRIAATGDRMGKAGRITGFGKEPALSLSERGHIVFHASLSGGGALDGVFLAGAGRRPTPVALSGQAAPGIPSGAIAALDAPMLNDRDDIGLLAAVQRGRGTIDVIYIWTGGRLRKAVAVGDPAPIGGSFSALGPPSLSNRGLLAFTALVEGGSAIGGVFVLEPGGRARQVVLAGDDGPLGVFARFGERLGIDAAGRVAFHAVVNNDARPAGIFLASTGGSRLVAALGADAPNGGRFAGFGLWPALAADGRVAFVGAIDGGATPVGVFLGGPDGLERVVAAGDPSPAGPIASFGLYPSVSMSARHALAFPIAPTAGAAGAEAIVVAEPAR